jgi:hypothetical protein
LRVYAFIQKQRKCRESAIDIAIEAVWTF